MTAYEIRISDWSSDVCSSDLCRAIRTALAADARAQPHPSARWFHLALRRACPRHRRARHSLCALLYVAGGPRPALLRVSSGFHGGDARHRPVGQPDPDRLLLGIDQPLLLPADRILAP